MNFAKTRFEQCPENYSGFSEQCPKAVLSQLRSAPRLSNTHGDGTSHPFDILQIVDCFFLFVSVAKVNEGKAALTTGLTVEGHRALADFSILAEQVDEVFSLCVPGEITNKNRQKINPKGITPFSHIVLRFGLSRWPSEGEQTSTRQPTEEVNCRGLPWSRHVIGRPLSPKRNNSLARTNDETTVRKQVRSLHPRLR